MSKGKRIKEGHRRDEFQKQIDAAQKQMAMRAAFQRTPIANAVGGILRMKKPIILKKDK